MTNAAQRIDRGIREEFVADNIVSADKIDLIKKNNTDASEGTHASIPKPTTPVKKIILVLSFLFLFIYLLIARVGLLYYFGFFFDRK